MAWVVLTLLVGTALIGLGGELADAGDELFTASLPWLILAVSLNLLGPLLQASAWRRFLPSGVRVPRGRLLETAGVMAAVSNSTPMFMAGLAAGTHLLATRGGVGHATALAVAALDQLAEGIAKVALLCVVLAWAPLPPGVRAGSWGLFGAVALLGMALWVSARHGPRMSVARGEGSPSGPWSRVRVFLGEWAEALEGVLSPGRMARGTGFVLGIKVVGVLAVYAVVRAVGADLPLWAIPSALLAVNVATMVTVTPGNLGVYEAAAYATWTLAGAAPSTALTLSLLQHATFLTADLGGGWLLATLASRAAAPRGEPG